MKMMLTIAGVVTLMAVTACDSAEEKSLENAYDNQADTIENQADALEEKADNMVGAVQSSTENMADAMEDHADAVEEVGEDAAENIGSNR